MVFLVKRIHFSGMQTTVIPNSAPGRNNTEDSPFKWSNPFRKSQIRSEKMLTSHCHDLTLGIIVICYEINIRHLKPEIIYICVLLSNPLFLDVSLCVNILGIAFSMRNFLTYKLKLLTICNHTMRWMFMLVFNRPPIMNYHQKY